MEEWQEWVEPEPEDAPTSGVLLLAVVAVLCLHAGLVLGSSPGGERTPMRARGASEADPASTLVVLGMSGMVLALLLASLLPEAPPRDPEPDAEPAPIPLCISCLDPFVDGAHFCPHCGAPLTWFATTGPYETIYAQAWLLGRAKHGPSRRVHLIGLGSLVAVYLGYFFLFPLGLFVSVVDTVGESGAAVELFLLLVYGTLFRGCRANQGPDDPDALDPEREPYGAPPYWTFDRWWFRPRAVPDEGAEIA